MAHHITLGAISTSSTFIDKKESQAEVHFKWDAIRCFIYLAEAFSSTNVNYDIFSGTALSGLVFYCLIGPRQIKKIMVDVSAYSSKFKYIITHNPAPPFLGNTLNFNKIIVSLYLFIAFAIIFGMPYMFMDFFVKQYTGRIDFQASLNPLLKAVHYGIICQTFMWSLLHANDLADSLFFFTSTFNSIPFWSECHKLMEKSKDECVFTKNITILCKTLIHMNKTIHINVTSAHHHYTKLFEITDRALLTKRCFLVTLVWIINFFLSTVSEHIIVKLFNLAYMIRSILTVVGTFYITLSTEELNGALRDVLNFSKKISVTLTASVVIYAFGIGLVGVYDFGTLSPFVIVDNAVVLFAVSFTFMACLRATLVAMLQRVVTKCILVKPSIGNYISYRYFIFAIMPLSADFLRAQRLFCMYLYMYLTITLGTHITMKLLTAKQNEYREIKKASSIYSAAAIKLFYDQSVGIYYGIIAVPATSTTFLICAFVQAAITFAISKILHSEFRTVKLIYITGLICFFGFLLSIPAGIYNSHYDGTTVGLSNSMLLLGALKATMIMYFYGVKKFAIDIHFWLGFKPTKYWIITWSVLPVTLLAFFIRWLLSLKDRPKWHLDKMLIGIICLILIVIIVLILELSTIIKYIAANNLSGLFLSTNKYGPPDPEERKRRRKYDEALSLRQCTHNCVLLDDRFDCNHMPITFKTNFDETTLQVETDESLTQVYKAGPSRKPRLSEMMEFQMQD